MNVGVLRDGLVVLANRNLRAALRWTDDQQFATLRSAIAEDDIERVEAAIARRGTGVSRLAFRARRTDGTEFDAELDFVGAAPSSGASAIVFLLADEAERRRVETRLTTVAFTDPLTGLGNRAIFLDRLRDALGKARETKQSLAVMMVDLEGFNDLKRAMGDDAADTVLREVARRLRIVLRSQGTAGRIDEDKFAFVLPNIGTAEMSAVVAGRTIRRLGEPMLIDGKACSIASNIGVAIYPDHGADVDSLIAETEIALLRSKRGGKNRYTVTGASADIASLPDNVVEWEPGYEVGIRVMDEQHRMLAELINNLGEDLKEGRDREHLLEALGALVEHAELHFATEEELMDAHLLPNTRSHRREHGQLIDDVRSLSVSLNQDSMALTVRYLHDWLLHHIGTVDRGLAHALQQRGVE